jgi:hypothetical protein
MPYLRDDHKLGDASLLPDIAACSTRLSYRRRNWRTLQKWRPRRGWKTGCSSIAGRSRRTWSNGRSRKFTTVAARTTHDRRDLARALPYLLDDRSARVVGVHSLYGRHGAQLWSDPSAKDASRVLRIPGFYHQKVNAKKGLNGIPHLVSLTENNDLARYEPEALFNAFAVAKVLGRKG